MSNFCSKGTISVNKDVLNLDLTLLGGQSFRWRKLESSTSPPEWRGVAYNVYWILRQSPNTVFFEAYSTAEINDFHNESSHFQNLLEKYFRLGFDLEYHSEKWKDAHKHFSKIAPNMNAVRLLRQDPLENILSFICSQNNNIQRISSMVNKLCSTYGEKIGTFNGETEYTFPSFHILLDHKKEMESKLRSEKFGYRSKFIAQVIAVIENKGGEVWFAQLQKLSYQQARMSLITLPGVGLKIADCICLMSLDHLEAVPVDTHILKLARTVYLMDITSKKSLSSKLYNDISSYFRTIYGPYAGWAQTVLFCSDLKKFKAKS